MPPKKKMKLDDTLESAYEDSSNYAIWKKAILTENNVRVVEILNYQWTVHYKLVPTEDSKIVEMFVDFASRYVFKDKVVIDILIQDGEKIWKKRFALEKASGQKFKMDIGQIGNDLKVECTIRVACQEYTARNSANNPAFFNSKRPHDAILLVEDNKFYVLKQCMATGSKYFNSLFFGESSDKDKKEFKIDDVKADELSGLLHMIYPSMYIIHDRNVLFLFKLADRFDIPTLLAKCGVYLSKFDNLSSLSLIERLELSDKHNISHLQVEVLKKLHAMNAAKFKEFLDENRDRIKS